MLLATTISCNGQNTETKSQTEVKETENAIFPKGEKIVNNYFTGNAYLTPLIAKDKNNDFNAGVVTFEPGARTNWHTHPKGQVLIVVSGNGFYQEKDKPAQPLAKGDVVNIPENVAHWHGAAPDSEFVHISISNVKDNKTVDWLAPVTDEEYNSLKVTDKR